MLSWYKIGEEIMSETTARKAALGGTREAQSTAVDRYVEKLIARERQISSERMLANPPQSKKNVA